MPDFSKIYEYINKTPENTNPAVLKSLIETEYTKPDTPTGINGVPYSITNNTDDVFLFDSGGEAHFVVTITVN